MCVAAIAWRASEQWPLVAIGNRDEFHARAALPLARWTDKRGLIAGRDVAGGGTWLGVHEDGRFALVTNFRMPEGPQPHRPSRGALVTDVLEGREPSDMERMNAFNLIAVDMTQAVGQQARFLTNQPQVAVHSLEPGIHGLSNGGFHDRWPKTRQLEAALSQWLDAGGSDLAPLLDALRMETPDPLTARQEEGPEPRFAPVFIRNPEYGTRCSTIVAVNRDGEGAIIERSFAPDGTVSGEQSVTFRWPEWPSH